MVWQALGPRHPKRRQKRRSIRRSGWQAGPTTPTKRKVKTKINTTGKLAGMSYLTRHHHEAKAEAETKRKCRNEKKRRDENKTQKLLRYCDVIADVKIHFYLPKSKTFASRRSTDCPIVSESLTTSGIIMSYYHSFCVVTSSSRSPVKMFQKTFEEFVLVDLKRLRHCFTIFVLQFTFCSSHEEHRDTC